MKRMLVGATLAGVALTVTILGASGNAAPNKERTFVLVQLNREEHFSLVDNPPRAPHGDRLSAGDLATLHQPLHSRSGRRVGAADASCTASRSATFNHARFVCNGVYSLKRGTLMIGVRFDIGSQPTIAITGGTGAYEGATGSVKQVSKRGREVLTVHLLT